MRAEESPRRAKQAKVEINEHGGELRLIHDWTATEVWEYIHSRSLPYCQLYDAGKKRIGCIFCPFAREIENIENALKYPQYVRYFITACERAIKTRIEQGKTSKYNSGAEMFVAWIEGGRGKKLKDFGVKFDYEKGEIVMENNEKIETSTTAVVTVENNNEVNPATTLDQLTLEVKFYLNQMGQNIIEVGKRLTQAKEMLPHGEFGKWLEKNFNLSDRTARRFMAVVERFGKTDTGVRFQNLNPTQMIIMLSLPEGTEEKFLDEMDARGTPFKDMTKRQADAAVKDWKAEAEKNKKEIEKLKKETEEKDAEIEHQYAQINSLRNENVKLWAENGEAEIKANKLIKENEQLKNNPVEVEVVPPDYEAQKKEIEELKAKNLELQTQLENSTVEILPEEDEEKENLRKELDTFKAREENFREEIATSQALNQFFMMANFLQEHQNCLPEVLKGYVETDGLTTERINQIAFVSSLLKKILKDIS